MVYLILVVVPLLVYREQNHSAFPLIKVYFPFQSFRENQTKREEMHSWSWLLGYPVSTLQAAIHTLLVSRCSLSHSSFSSLPTFSPSFLIFDFVYCSVIFSCSIWENEKRQKQKVKDRNRNRASKRGNYSKRVSLVCCRDGGKSEEEDKKVRLLIFPLFFHLLLVSHKGAVVKSKAPIFSNFTPFSFPHTLFSVPAFFLPLLSIIRIILLCQISILICLHSPPL